MIGSEIYHKYYQFSHNYAYLCILQEKPKRIPVLICGGRKFADQLLTNKVLTLLNKKFKFSKIIHGAATGADTLADEWGKENKIEIKDYPITKEDWGKYGLSAGPLRNARMLEQENPILVIAFPGDRGTRDMVMRAESQNTPVFCVLDKRK